jgi:hypothetical protein
MGGLPGAAVARRGSQDGLRKKAHRPIPIAQSGALPLLLLLSPAKPPNREHRSQGHTELQAKNE